MIEKLLIWLSWKLPKNLAYWAAIRVMTYNYGGSPCDRTCADALKGWK